VFAQPVVEAYPAQR
jgi:hypothetical protein